MRSEVMPFKTSEEFRDDLCLYDPDKISTNNKDVQNYLDSIMGTNAKKSQKNLSSIETYSTNKKATTQNRRDLKLRKKQKQSIGATTQDT